MESPYPPIYYTIAYGDINGTKLLLDSDNTNTKYDMINTPIKTKDNLFIYPLCIAFGNADLHMMELLLSNGAISCLNNPNCKAKHPHTKFFFYIIRSKKYTNLAKMYLTNSEEISIDNQFKQSNSNGYTPLHYATLYNPSLIPTIVKTGFDIDAQIDNGSSALHLAVLNNDELTALTLIRYGIDIYIKNKKGYTVAYYATKANMHILVRVLKEIHKWRSILT